MSMAIMIPLLSGSMSRQISLVDKSQDKKLSIYKKWKSISCVFWVLFQALSYVLDCWLIPGRYRQDISAVTCERAPKDGEVVTFEGVLQRSSRRRKAVAEGNKAILPEAKLVTAQKESPGTNSIACKLVVLQLF